VELQLDLAQFNADMLHKGAMGMASQLILKHTNPMLQVIEAAPVSGVYALEGQSLRLKHASSNRREALAPNEAYVLRIQQAGEYAYLGGDLAILFLNTTICDAQGQLNPSGHTWVQALRNCFALRNLNEHERSAIELAHNPANVKSARAQ
jgi:uncharacterized MAPEG superfamily protein